MKNKIILTKEVIDGLSSVENWPKSELVNWKISQGENVLAKEQKEEKQ